MSYSRAYDALYLLTRAKLLVIEAHLYLAITIGFLSTNNCKVIFTTQVYISYCTFLFPTSVSPPPFFAPPLFFFFYLVARANNSICGLVQAVRILHTNARIIYIEIFPLLFILLFCFLKTAPAQSTCFIRRQTCVSSADPKIKLLLK